MICLDQKIASNRSLVFGLLMMMSLSLAACKKDAKDSASTSGGERAGEGEGEDNRRCPDPQSDPRPLEVSVYDTNRDGRPDVRKVFLIREDARDLRATLICREADLNGDGLKDIVRFYADDGDPIREESDRNFDGRIDSITIFEDGVVFRRDLDEDFDGRIDTRIYYEDGSISRIERDLAGRKGDEFQVDRFEYLEGGHIVRMGTDLDGDGSVDRWERDEELEAQKRAEERRAEEEAQAQAEAEEAEDTEEASE